MCRNRARARARALYSVVNPQLRIQQRALPGLVDHPVLIRDGPRPEACQGVFQRLGFAEAGEWFACGSFDEFVDGLDHASLAKWFFLPFWE